MMTLRNVVRGLTHTRIQHHQDNAQREINHATAVVEQQRQETDLLAQQVWRAMGGHP